MQSHCWTVASARAWSLVGSTAMRKGGISGTPMKRAVDESTAGIVTAAGSNCSRATRARCVSICAHYHAPATHARGRRVSVHAPGPGKPVTCDRAGQRVVAHAAEQPAHQQQRVLLAGDGKRQRAVQEPLLVGWWAAGGLVGWPLGSVCHAPLPRPVTCGGEPGWRAGWTRAERCLVLS